jgi:hypothetical protein
MSPSSSPIVNISRAYTLFAADAAAVDSGYELTAGMTNDFFGYYLAAADYQTVVIFIMLLLLLLSFLLLWLLLLFLLLINVTLSVTVV